MSSPPTSRRYVFRTEGVCPPEIHFNISGGKVEDIRFVGGGCPGNALLVSRLLQGRPVDDIKSALAGIVCRNETSCPDQLALAIEAVETGALDPAESFRTCCDPHPRGRIGLIGDLHGDDGVWHQLLHHIRAHELDAVYCLGNLAGGSPTHEKLLKAVRKSNILSVQGDRDWRYAQGTEAEGDPPLSPKERDWLLQRPQVLNFSIAGRNGLAFYGDFIQRLPGFSDFEPFALEINMVCGLTRFMTDPTVFPALEAMLPQFAADLILFGQTGDWGHWRVGDKDFVSVGAARQAGGVAWGILEAGDQEVNLKVMNEREAP